MEVDFRFVISGVCVCVFVGGMRMDGIRNAKMERGAKSGALVVVVVVGMSQG